MPKSALQPILNLKNIVIKDKTEYRKIRFGLCKGFLFPINFRHDARTWLGLYEIEIKTAVRQFVKPGDCCYDLGAARGYYTLALARLSYPGKVYSIDASAKACEIIQKNYALNQNKISTVTALCRMIGDRVDATQSVTTLDELIFKNGWTPPNVIKMDVEEHELEVLNGARETIRRYVPKFIIETHSKELEEKCVSLLEEEGYQCTIIPNNKFFPDLRPIPHNRWFAAERVKILSHAAITSSVEI